MFVKQHKCCFPNDKIPQNNFKEQRKPDNVGTGPHIVAARF